MKPESSLMSVLTEARETLGVSDAALAEASENPRFSEQVRARLKVSTQNALANIEVINERASEARATMGKRLRAVVNSREPVWVRIRKVYALLDELTAFNEGHVACRKGCAHCCHVPVAVPQVEAEMIGMAIGRRPKKVAGHRDEGHYASQAYGYHTPCPFLKDNQCSIYEHRPLACRKLVNADIDDLLCQLIEPPGPPVPYLDYMEFEFALFALSADKNGVKSADIREYFPPKPPK